MNLVSYRSIGPIALWSTFKYDLDAFFNEATISLLFREAINFAHTICLEDQFIELNVSFERLTRSDSTNESSKEPISLFRFFLKDDLIKSLILVKQNQLNYLKPTLKVLRLLSNHTDEHIISHD